MSRMECLRETCVKDWFENRNKFLGNNGHDNSFILRLETNHISRFSMLAIKANAHYSFSSIATEICTYIESDGVFARNLRERLA